jgi:hypothetical protein
MPRRPNNVSTVIIKISTTPKVAAYLNQLVAGGLYGKTRPEAAERLIAKGVENLLREGILIAMRPVKHR